MYKILQTILKRKIASGILLAAVVVGSYLFFRGDATAETKYVLAAVEKGTIIASITGSGQVSSLQQVDIKPKTGPLKEKGKHIFLFQVKPNPYQVSDLKIEPPFPLFSGRVQFSL